MLKTCTKCKEEKPATTEYFYKHKKSKDGLNWRCKPCVIEQGHWCRVKKVYGITKEEYDVMLKDQNNVCAICENGERIKCRNKLSIDHNHTTGKVRGLLCDDCNNMIGRSKESIMILNKAIKYLGKYK